MEPMFRASTPLSSPNRHQCRVEAARPRFGSLAVTTLDASRLAKLGHSKRYPEISNDRPSRRSESAAGSRSPT